MTLRPLSATYSISKNSIIGFMSQIITKFWLNILRNCKKLNKVNTISVHRAIKAKRNSLRVIRNAKLKLISANNESSMPPLIEKIPISAF